MATVHVGGVLGWSARAEQAVALVCGVRVIRLELAVSGGRDCNSGPSLF